MSSTRAITLQGSRHITIYILALLSALLISPTPTQSQTTDLVTASVNPSIRTVLRGHHEPWARTNRDRGPVAGDTLLQHLSLVLKRSPEQQKAFEEFLQQLQDPSSPNYHRWLTPVQLGKRFGASPHDLAAVSEWLRGQGLRVNSVANSRMMIDFSGNAALVGATFATELRYYVVRGERRMAAASDPQIPAALERIIQSVTGLNTLNDHPYHGAEQVEVPAGGAGHDLPALSLCNNNVCTHFTTPQDFYVIYDENNAYTGTGQTIAVIGRARVFNPDIENFQSLTGLPVGDPVVIVPPNGVDPGPAAGTGGAASGDQVEATLDVMRAGSTAPQATIDLVVSGDTSGSDGLGIAAQYAVDHSPVIAQVMNISYGACEADRTLADVQFWDTLFSAAAAEGISVFTASGDGGAAGCDAYFQPPPATQVASPNYICSSSYSTCVGGTEFADSANPSAYWNLTNDSFLGSALGYIPEGGWNEPLNGKGTTQAAASGGGFSSYIPTPSWQVGTGVPGTQGRYTPDLAFSSSGHDGYFGCLAASSGTHPGDCVVHNGSFYFEYFFGTSAAAPDMAGVAALLNEKLGGAQGAINQRVYLLASVPANGAFHDVTPTTSGVSSCAVTTPSMCNNSTPSPTGLTGGLSGYLVTTGYDEVTGWGSLDIANFLSTYNPGSATVTTVASSQNPANFGATVTFTATVSTAGANAATGLVNLLDGGANIGSGALSTLNGSQKVVFTLAGTLAPGPHSITAAYVGDVNNAASTSSVLTQTITPPTFTWAANGSTAGTVLSGQAASYNFTAKPTSAATFAANVTFSCSGLPDATVNCSFNPPQINAGSGMTPVQLTVTTTGPNTGPGTKLRRRAENRSPWLPLTLPLVGMFVVFFAERRKLRPVVIARNCLPLALLALLIACGGGSSAPPPIGVTAGPGAPASVFPNNAGWPAQTAQFTASVTNTTNTAVTWSVTTANGGTIDKNTGLYTAPTVASGLPTSVTVTATSVADPTKSGSATESLTAATLPGTYTITVTAAESTTTNSATVTLAAQ